MVSIQGLLKTAAIPYSTNPSLVEAGAEHPNVRIETSQQEGFNPRYHTPYYNYGMETFLGWLATFNKILTKPTPYTFSTEAQKAKGNSFRRLSCPHPHPVIKSPTSP